MKMSFVLPKAYMLSPMLKWGQNLLNNDSLTKKDINKFNFSIKSHGLQDHDALHSLSSQLQSKLVDSSLSDQFASMKVNNKEIKLSNEEMEVNNEEIVNMNNDEHGFQWSDFDSDDENIMKLNTEDVSEHLNYVSAGTRLKKSQIHRMNVRRSGRMRT